MAEFQDVIIQMKRMCDHFRPTCNGCPLCLKKFCGEQPKDIRSHPALVEAAVMRWAEEHPEPVYPTWEDWLLDIGVIRKGMSWSDLNIPLRQPIPANLAEKLGLQPKEG